MTEARPTWSAGIVNHGNYADLEACLDSLALQTWPPERVVVWDTGVDAAVFLEVSSRHSEVVCLSGTNLGYAGGANRVVTELRGHADFSLILNPDVVLDATFSENLLGAVSAELNVAIATGKLLRPGRELIDSAGIVFPRHRRPRDRGSEERDAGQFDAPERVGGASGAAMIIRETAIEELTIEGELFDETFFAYHEDTDLCWRARRLGFEILYVPTAVAVHKRGWRKGRRLRVPVIIRRHSFKNHYLQVMKNETLGQLVLNLPWLAVWEVLRLAHVVFRERDLLPAYGDAWRARPAAIRQRKIISQRATGSESGGVPSGPPR
jgi:GT2 family glycosyltransferase